MGETKAKVANRDGAFYVHCGIRVVNNIEEVVAVEVTVGACRNAITSCHVRHGQVYFRIFFEFYPGPYAFDNGVRQRCENGYHPVVETGHAPSLQECMFDFLEGT